MCARTMKKRSGTGEYVLKGHETYVRVKCTDKNGKTAWSNPIFMQGRKRG